MINDKNNRIQVLSSKIENILNDEKSLISNENNAIAFVTKKPDVNLTFSYNSLVII